MAIGCFFSCLGPSKHRNSRKTANISPPSDQMDELIHTSHSSAIRNQDYAPCVIQETKEKIGEHFNSQKVQSLEEITGIKTQKASFQQNHRYQNCTDSEEEFEDLNHAGKGEKASAMEEHSESLFSISMEFKSRVCVSGKDDNEVNSPMPNPNLLDHKLLASGLDQDVIESHSIENLTQLRAPKYVITPPLKDRAKENTPSQQHSETSLRTSNVSNREDMVDMSLTNWLVDSDLQRQRQLLPLSFHDRPILGALTVKELKEVSATSSPPGRSRRKSPRTVLDDIPIIGSGGTCWSFTEQINMKSE